MEKIEKGLGANILRMENDSRETKGELLENFIEAVKRKHLEDINDIRTDKGKEDAEKIFNEKIFNGWKKYFWANEERFLEIPKPKNAIEQAILWNSCQCSLEGKIMDGFKH